MTTEPGLAINEVLHRSWRHSEDHWVICCKRGTITCNYLGQEVNFLVGNEGTIGKDGKFSAWGEIDRIQWTCVLELRAVGMYLHGKVTCDGEPPDEREFKVALNDLRDDSSSSSSSASARSPTTKRRRCSTMISPHAPPGATGSAGEG